MTSAETDKFHDFDKAYLEYRRACYLLTYRNAKDAGLLDLLSKPRTVDELSVAFGCARSKVESLQCIVRALARFGAIEKIDADGAPPKYLVSPAFSEDKIRIDHHLLVSAVGPEHAKEVVDARNYSAMVTDLRSEQNNIGAAFDDQNLKHWNDFLEMPFYKHHRNSAVAAISRPGARCLDLGSGLGMGVVDLARRTGHDGLVIGVEVSSDFLRESIKLTASCPQVRYVYCNLDNGFPFLRDGYFDGAMIIGAFHFLTKREEFFAEVHRVLKPGGVFCLGHVYTNNGAYDQEIMDLRFATRIPRGYAITPNHLAELARGKGFEGPVKKFFTGCIGWFQFTKGIR